MKEKKIQDLREKGITLIALVVTIIILLILAGVTLNMALSGDGLFSRARNATEKYKKAQEDEAKLISEIGKEMNSEYVGEYVTGYKPKNNSTGCTIKTETSGADKEQIIKTETMKWRIWDYDGTTLRLISETPTEAKLQLKGTTGYNNGVYAINEVCRECYNSDEEGVEVRNLRRSDIEAVSNYDYTKYKHQPTSGAEVIGDSGSDLIYYGETKKYDDNYQSPVMWSNHDYMWTYKCDNNTKKGTGDPDCRNPWEQEFGSNNEKGSGNTTSLTEFTQSYYYHNYLNKQGEFNNPKYLDMIFTKGKDDSLDYTYWLAGRYSEIRKDLCIFGLHYARNNTAHSGVGGYGVFCSNRLYW